MTSRRILIAPDSFKGTATAADAARALADGWSSVRPQDTVVRLPLADGGEGTLDAFEAAVPGARRRGITVTGPEDASVATHWLWLPDATAVVELANTSGLGLLSAPRPLDAHTVGFGQAIAAAVAAGARRLLLALGGSASTDGGAGALTALGARLLDGAGRPVAAGNAGLGRLASVDLGPLPPLPADGAWVLSDVASPLLGPRGAAAVFGPQKGATAGQVTEMDANLARFASLLPADPLTPGAGAAGGTGFGLLAWGATVTAGSSAVGDALGVPAAVAASSVVVTGEGRFDSQTAEGKVVSYVLELCAASSTSALLVAGQIDADTGAFAGSRSLTELGGSSTAAMADTLALLRAAGAGLAAEIAD